MSTHRATRLGITALAVVALVASGASPITAVPSVVPSAVSVATLTMPVRPAGLDVDAAGNVYVAGYGAGAEVYVFAPGRTTHDPARTLTGVPRPSDVMVKDSTGEVYVSSYTSGEVLVFDPGATTANPAKTRCCVNQPTGVALSAAGNLLVSSWSGDNVIIFGGSSLTPTGSFATLDMPVGLEVHPVTGELFVPGAGTATVQVFDRGSTLPNGAKTLTGLSWPYGVAFHPANGSVHVTNFGSVSASVFASGQTTANAGEALTGLDRPWGVAVSPVSGQVYVSDYQDRVLVYPAPTPTVLSVAPVTGPVTGGTVVTITGTNLGMVSAASFGSAAAALTATPPTYSTVEVASPAAASAGPVTVSVSSVGSIAGKADAFTYTAVAPGPATAVAGVPGNGRVTVSWAAPVFTGGAPITGYVVTPSPSGAPCATTGTSCVISGLVNGQPYTFTVTTTNAAALSSTTAASAAVVPVISVWLKVKAKKASYKPPRRGVRTLVSYAKKSSKATVVVARSCSDGTTRTSAQLCTFKVSKKGKVQVRVKGYRHVRITIAIQAVPKPSAGAAYGPSAVWTRTWRVK